MRNIYSGVVKTTGKRILRNTVGFAAVLCAAALPGYCATSFLSYTGSWSTLSGANGIVVNCSATCTNANETLSSFSVPIIQLTVSNANDTADNGQWAITGGTEVYNLTGTTVTVTVSGTIGACTGCVGTSNLTGVSGALTTITYAGLTGGIPFNAALTGTSFDTTGATRNNFALNLGAATSLTDSATLLADLGETLTSGSVTQVPASGANATGAGGTTSGNHTFNLTGSTTLGVTLTSTTTPEPVSFILFGTGLMAVGLIARRRRVSQN